MLRGLAGFSVALATSNVHSAERWTRRFNFISHRDQLGM
jgi:hypothetical protein